MKNAEGCGFAPRARAEAEGGRRPVEEDDGQPGRAGPPRGCARARARGGGKAGTGPGRFGPRGQGGRTGLEGRGMAATPSGKQTQTPPTKPLRRRRRRRKSPSGASCSRGSPPRSRIGRARAGAEPRDTGRGAEARARSRWWTSALPRRSAHNLRTSPRSRDAHHGAPGRPLVVGHGQWKDNVVSSVTSGAEKLVDAPRGLLRAHGRASGLDPEVGAEEPSGSLEPLPLSVTRVRSLTLPDLLHHGHRRLVDVADGDVDRVGRGHARPSPDRQLQRQHGVGGHGRRGEAHDRRGGATERDRRPQDQDPLVGDGARARASPDGDALALVGRRDQAGVRPHRHGGNVAHDDLGAGGRAGALVVGRPELEEGLEHRLGETCGAVKRATAD